MRQRWIAVTLITVAALAACGDNANHQTIPPPDGSSPPVTQNVCDVTPGGATILLTGTVLTPGMVYQNGQVAIDSTGHITCVGTSCAAGGETTIACHDAVISPGLINTHDHISFDQRGPYADSGERYEDRQQWRKGLDGHASISDAGPNTDDGTRWTELRFVMGGATSIVSTTGTAGFLRNLDHANTQEGLGKGAVIFDTFPLDDSGGGRQTANCNYGSTAETAAQVAPLAAYEPHTAEGIDATAHNEFLCESSVTYDTTTPGVSNNIATIRTAMIHAIGLEPADYNTMATAGTSLIWSPRSNITLYGDTARVSVAARLGVNIALGTDWVITGSMNLLRELACADGFNATYLDHFFSDQQLWQMVTANAAVATQTGDVIGVLAPGRVADIAIFASHGRAPFRSVIEAEPKDVALVMRGGKVLYGDDAVVNALAQSCDTVDVCGTAKRVCAMAEVGKTYAALQASVGANDYPAFACGVPQDEPMCMPRRPNAVAGSTVFTGAPVTTGDASQLDSDGDGIPDASDNCPHVFNPIRPMDGGHQPDADGDGLGDACDPCPLDATSQACTPVSLADRDHDGVPDIADNCPNDHNPDQADADSDGHGDVCDVCPADANPGIAPCPRTIYQVKSGQVPVGAPVRVTNALVTAVSNAASSNGFFVQVKETDTGYAGAANSGMFVFTSSKATVAVGTRVTIDGAVDNFHGELEVDNIVGVTSTSTTSEAAPAPTVISYADVNGGTAAAAALEGALVTLGASTVAATTGTTLTLTDGAQHNVTIDNFVFAPPAATVGQAVASATGILALRGGAFKLELRSAADLVFGTGGTANIASFGPALSFARVAATPSAAPTFPTPLTVALSGAVATDTTIALTSDTPDALTVDSVTVPAGMLSAAVPVTAKVANPAAVSITATLGSQTMTAQVRVLGMTEAPSKVTLSPATISLASGATTTFTAALDLPALGDTPVTLTVDPALGTAPATVTVLDGQLAATFSFKALATSGTITIGASLGTPGSTDGTATVTVTATTPTGHLLINEVDYDQSVNPDSTEFVELYNPTDSDIPLAGKGLVLVNGANNPGAVYGSPAVLDLGGASVASLPSHGYLVIAGAKVIMTLSATTPHLQTAWTTDGIQNGSPDGMALIDTTTHTVIDALSYEGPITSVMLPGFTGAVSLVQADTPAATVQDAGDGSLCRSPDGGAWKLCATITPGAAN